MCLRTGDLYQQIVSDDLHGVGSITYLVDIRLIDGPVSRVL